MNALWRSIIMGWIAADSASFFDRLNDLNWYTTLLLDWIEDVDCAPGSTFLEVGCGPGNLAKRIAQKGHQVCAIDRSEKMIQRAKRKSTSVEFIVGDATCLAPKATPFDIAIAASLINIIDDPLALLRSMAKQVKLGGRVSVLFPTPQFSEIIPSFIAEKRLKGFSAEALRTWGAMPPKMSFEKVENIFFKAGLVSLEAHTYLDGGIGTLCGIRDE